MEKKHKKKTMNEWKKLQKMIENHERVYCEHLDFEKKIAYGVESLSQTLKKNKK